MIVPECRVNAELEDRLNEATDIVTKDFTKRFVSLGRLSFASQTVAELRFDHAECRFDVAALVVLAHEPLMIELIVVVHLPPQIASLLPASLFNGGSSRSPLAPRWPTVGFERNVRHGRMVYHGLQVRRHKYALSAVTSCIVKFSAVLSTKGLKYLLSPA